MPSTTETDVMAQVEQALDQIRPAIQMDGGNVELVDVEDGVVKVRMTGACGG